MKKVEHNEFKEQKNKVVWSHQIVDVSHHNAFYSSIFIYAYQIQQVFFCQSFGRMNNTEKENIKVPTAKNIYSESQNIKIKSTFLTYST